jgi:dipeptidyl aminopeptidase/acylaminoacyl peptidase
VKFESIGTSWPGLAKQTLAVTEAVGIPMRGGGMREALFTLPADGAKKAPLVVFADGAQLTGGFEPASHFLASRGYAVLRSYFRGTEQDADWWHRPYQDWHGVQFDELLDVTRWAAQRAEVDPQRICIVGRGSYGGYQALLAAARTDAPFKCAVSFSGFSDLARPRRDVAVANSIGEFKPQGPSDELVRRESPLKRAAEFRVPVLMFEPDNVTPGPSAPEGGREMAAALAAANKPHKLVLIDEVDDAYLRVAYTELVKFLEASLR